MIELFLRKRFYEAKILGASAVLLICSILDGDALAEYIDISHGLGLSALVETHDENEVAAALGAGARIIGVNNRNLKTFEVDISRIFHAPWDSEFPRRNRRVMRRILQTAS